jgi:hypothetical protein
MSLSSSTLIAIQKAGAAAFTADEKLKQAAKNYADRVHAAIAANPYNASNDALIENWKTVARLSQTLAGIEAEIKKVFQVAAELTGDDQPTVVSAPVAAAPKRAAKKAVIAPVAAAPVTTGKAKNAKKTKPAARAAAVAPIAIDLTPTDVVIKSKKKAAKAKKANVSAPVVAAPAKVAAKSKPKAAAPKAKPAAAKGTKVKVQPGELNGNAAKLLPKLEQVLNTTDYSEISQTAMANEADIALGSMTAALKKLMELGRISAGPAGSYMLAQPALTAATADAGAN